MQNIPGRGTKPMSCSVRAHDTFHSTPRQFPHVASDRAPNSTLWCRRNRHASLSRRFDQWVQSNCTCSILMDRWLHPWWQLLQPPRRRRPLRSVVLRANEPEAGYMKPRTAVEMRRGFCKALPGDTRQQHTQRRQQRRSASKAIHMRGQTREKRIGGKHSRVKQRVEARLTSQASSSHGTLLERTGASNRINRLLRQCI